ncbi:MAG: hypothetical protein ACT4OL_11545 [Nitrospiraceae bacterium]
MRTVISRLSLWKHQRIIMAVVLTLWGSAAWGATLTWDANTEPDLAGYYVYQCSEKPCGKAYGTARLLVILGKVTSFNIGTPAVVQHYRITAYDFKNNESMMSNVATYDPYDSIDASPPPAPTAPPPPAPTPEPTCTWTSDGWCTTSPTTLNR